MSDLAYFFWHFLRFLIQRGLLKEYGLLPTWPSSRGERIMPPCPFGSNGPDICKCVHDIQAPMHVQLSKQPYHFQCILHVPRYKILFWVLSKLFFCRYIILITYIVMCIKLEETKIRVPWFFLVLLSPCGTIEDHRTEKFHPHPKIQITAINSFTL